LKGCFILSITLCLIAYREILWQTAHMDPPTISSYAYSITTVIKQGDVIIIIALISIGEFQFKVHHVKLDRIPHGVSGS